MDTVGLIFTIILIVAAVLVGLYFIGNKLMKKQDESQKMIQQNKQVVSAFVIDKKKQKIADANFPKGAFDKIPWYMKNRKLPMAKVKIGPQIITMIVEPNVFKTLPTKKNMKLEISGAYIMNYNTAKKGEPAHQAPRKLTFREKMMNKVQDLRKGMTKKSEDKKVKNGK